MGPHHRAYRWAVVAVSGGTVLAGIAYAIGRSVT